MAAAQNSLKKQSKTMVFPLNPLEREATCHLEELLSAALL